jgi:hypothetical protein
MQLHPPAAGTQITLFDVNDICDGLAFKRNDFLISSLSLCRTPEGNMYVMSGLNVMFPTNSMRVSGPCSFNQIRCSFSQGINACLRMCSWYIWLDRYQKHQSRNVKLRLTKTEASTIRNPEHPLTSKSGLTTPSLLE